jgi:hypothetical protein
MSAARRRHGHESTRAVTEQSVLDVAMKPGNLGVQ